jgi:CRP/FNR family transcriptional regulator, cyclic AMP receptor protein
MASTLLDALPDRERELILAKSRPRRFARGEVVFHEGDPGDSLHLIVKGRLAVRISTPGGEMVILNVLSPGQFFGELALLRRDPPLQRTATVTALETSETLWIPGTAFTAVRQQHPGVEQLLTEILAERVEALSRRLIETLYLSVDRRVYLRLAELAAIYRDGDGPVTIPLSQDVLAEVAGASRPTVNQALQKLAAQHIVALARGRIEVLRPDELDAWIGTV